MNKIIKYVESFMWWYYPFALDKDKFKALTFYFNLPSQLNLLLLNLLTKVFLRLNYTQNLLKLFMACN